MITIDDARRLGAAELAGEGLTGPLWERELAGGWRFWVAGPPEEVGGLHVLVVAATGRVRPISSGMLDAAAEAELAR